MSNILFRKAGGADREAILSLYDRSRGTANCTWDESYPSAENIDADLAADSLFVLTDLSAVIGAVSIAPENELDDLSCWTVRQSACEIARVAIAPEYRGKSLALSAVKQIENVCRERGFRVIHLLVAQVNIAAVKTYLNAGYRFLDRVEMFENNYFACEKIL